MSGAELVVSNNLGLQILELQEMKGMIKSPELGGAINLSSVEYVLPENKAKEAEANNPRAKNIIKCHDNSVAILKNGVWIDQYSGATLDLSYYPELLSSGTKQLN